MPNENIAHRIIKLQLSDLVIGHNYSVRYSVHNADALKVTPLLDKTVFDFKAWATTQNAFCTLLILLMKALLLLKWMC